MRHQERLAARTDPHPSAKQKTP